jgi:hypothetical protein
MREEHGGKALNVCATCLTQLCPVGVVNFGGIGGGVMIDDLDGLAGILLGVAALQLPRRRLPGPLLGGALDRGEPADGASSFGPFEGLGKLEKGPDVACSPLRIQFRKLE